MRNPDFPTCDWQTSNALTEYQVVKCEYEALYVNKEGHHLCLPHADLWKTLTSEVCERIETSTCPECGQALDTK